MAYCTLAQVQAQWPTLGTALAAQIPAWITIADSQIDSSLRSAGYETPISGTAPEIITLWSVNLVGIMGMNRLYEHQNAMVDGEMLDALSDAKANIANTEEMIRSGKLKLKIARIYMNPIASGDSLSTPEVSQFALPDGFPTITEDIND